MTYLIDTCVISETRQRRQDAGVKAWFESQDPISLYLSAITIGEIENGIQLIGDTKKAKELSKWLSDLETLFGRRILSVNTAVAECWGRMLAENALAGKTRPAIDTLIAATAKVDGHVLVTRNERHMQGLGVEILNPFSNTTS